MRPAFNVPLSDTEKKLIGELCAMQNQIEFLMAQIVGHLLAVPYTVANKVLGSTSIRTNADVWMSLVREKCDCSDIKELAECAYKEIEALSQGRNDFVHALFATKTTTGGFGISTLPNPPGGLSPVAVRVKGTKKREVADLRKVHDHAAKLSVMVAHIYWVLVEHPRHGKPSPWRDKFPPPP